MPNQDTDQQLDAAVLAAIKGGADSAHKAMMKAREKYPQVSRSAIDKALQRIRKRGLIKYTTGQRWVTTDILPCEHCGGTGHVKAASATSSPVATSSSQTKSKKEVIEEEPEEKAKETEAPGFKGSTQIF